VKVTLPNPGSSKEYESKYINKQKQRRQIKTKTTNGKGGHKLPSSCYGCRKKYLP
jgi:hypothetical protein